MKAVYKNTLKIALTLVVVGVAYYFAVAKLPNENLTTAEIVAQYQYTASEFEPIYQNQTEFAQEFTFAGYDGETVYGKIAWPKTKEAKHPLLIGIHAMGRSYPRWFQDSLKGRPTVTSVDKITESALAKGFAVVAIDSRFHGKRKVAEKSLRVIWNNMHYFGDKSDYQDMVVKTAIDNRSLLDWLENHDRIDATDITVAGYSMGGQVSLLMGAVDDRIKNVIAIVPPYVDNRIAAASPHNVVHLMEDKRVLFIYGENDDVASPQENKRIFDKISTNDKQLVELDADHILPLNYVQIISEWLGESQSRRLLQ